MFATVNALGKKSVGTIVIRIWNKFAFLKHATCYVKPNHRKEFWGKFVAIQ